MRIFVAGLLAASLIATHVLAGEAPLPSGKAAGVKTAQETDNTVFFLFGAGLVAAGAILLANGDSNGPLQTGTPPATSTGT